MSAERIKITVLKDVKIRKRFEEKLTKLAILGAPNSWRHIKDGVSQACDEVYQKKRGGEVKEIHGGGMKR